MARGEGREDSMGTIDEEVEGTVGVKGREVRGTGAGGDCAL